MRPDANRVSRLNDVFTVYAQVEFDDAATSIKIDNESLSTWCAALCLLEKELVDSIKLVDSDSKSILDLSRSTARNTTKGSLPHLFLAIDATSLNYWIVWLLRYYRDNVYDVDHIHIEFYNDENLMQPFDLELRLDYVVPEISLA